MYNHEKLVNWVNEEINKRSWSYSEAARQGGISHVSISQILGGLRPGYNVCRGLARAFDTPIETVYRYAGLLPDIHEMDKASISELIEIFRNLSADQREMVIEMARRFYAQRQRD